MFNIVKEVLGIRTELQHNITIEKLSSQVVVALEVEDDLTTMVCEVVVGSIHMAGVSLGIVDTSRKPSEQTASIRDQTAIAEINLL